MQGKKQLPWKKQPVKIYAADYLYADSNAWPQVEPKYPSSAVSSKEKKHISKHSISKYSETMACSNSNSKHYLEYWDLDLKPMAISHKIFRYMAFFLNLK